MRTAQIREWVRTDEARAKVALAALLADRFQIEARKIELNNDQYSLNSLNGFFETDDGAFFFKFHQEEGEEEMRGEYYRADLLQREGLPVDMPVVSCTDPGEQVLIYRRRTDRRFSDLLFDLEAQPGDGGMSELRSAAVSAERKLNEHLFQVAQRTLRPVAAKDVEREAIHRLFYERLVDLPQGTYPGGRLQSFYVDQTFDLPGVTLGWDEFSNAALVLNGQRMKLTFAELFDQAFELLNPAALASAGGIVAHGDAHNANVWFERDGADARLVYFDPAFAGEHVPSLLAEIKATFHNVFAHPLWLYNPEQAEAVYTARAAYDGETLTLDTDWRLGTLRQDLLEAKVDAYWRPFLHHLQAQGLLPANWKTVMRSSLAMCPAVVTNLRADHEKRGPIASAIGLHLTILMGSEAMDGQTIVDDLLAAIDPNIG